MIKVSVIIPVYNMERLIEECLESVLNQTLKDIEVICIDDGSSDGTLAVLKRYEEKQNNVRVLRQNRAGAGAARNKGIEAARGEFIAFMDSDDFYSSDDVLAYLYEGAVRNNVLMAGGNFYRVLEGRNENSRRYAEYIDEEKTVTFREYPYVTGFHRYIVKKELIDRYHIRFPDYVRGEDLVYLLYARLVAKEIWVTNKDIYALRAFDKKIEFTSSKVIHDMLATYMEVIKIAKEHNLPEVQKTILDNMRKYYFHFIFHIVNGDKKLYELGMNLGESIIEKSDRERYLACWNMDYITSKFNENERQQYILEQEIQKFHKVIVYGAGQRGKNVYDFLNVLENVDFLGFAVTNLHPQGTARGIKIRSLDDYVNYQDSSLVLICGNEDSSNEMKIHAIDLGFKNIFKVDENFGFIGLKVTDGQFAFNN